MTRFSRTTYVCMVALLAIASLLAFVDGKAQAQGRIEDIPSSAARAPKVQTLEEMDLSGLVPEIPDVLVIHEPRSQAEIAAYLKTTPTQLSRRNPGIADPVPAGTMLVIPSIYEVEGEENLASVGAATGFSDELLRGHNPNLIGEEELKAGQVLIVPRVQIVYKEVNLSSAADEMHIGEETLRAANPDLATSELGTVQAGTVLIVPSAASFSATSDDE